jgi:hypothetical protein
MDSDSPKHQQRGIVHADFQGHDIVFTGDGWFDATAAAAKFGKRPIDWLKLPETERYVDALCELHEVKKSHFVRTVRGGNVAAQGTWLHPKLAVPFARWLDVRFAVWCDGQIEKLLHRFQDRLRARHSAAASFKSMNNVLELVRKDDGKETASHHYANEARLINRVITGNWAGMDRDELPVETLDLLAHLEARNTVLIARGVDFKARDVALREAAAGFKQRLLQAA